MLPPSSGGAIMGAWMTQPQMLAFAIIGGTMILFIWGRLRYDLVAILALLVSILAGTVPAKDAFSGFSDDIIIIIGSALVLSAALARSGIIESMLSRLTESVTRVRWKLTILVSSFTVFAVLDENIVAIPIFIPSVSIMATK